LRVSIESINRHLTADAFSTHQVVDIIRVGKREGRLRELITIQDLFPR